MAKKSASVYIGFYDGSGKRKRSTFLRAKSFIQHKFYSVALRLLRFLKAVLPDKRKKTKKQSKKKKRVSIVLPHISFILKPKRQKKRKTKKTTTSKTISPFYTFRVFFVGVVTALAIYIIPVAGYTWLKTLPNPKLLSQRDIQVTTKIYDRNRTLLYEVYTDENRSLVPLDEIPEHVKQATIAIEDQDFYRHNGVSIRGIVRALRVIMTEKKIHGGSTITQQLIKSALLSPEVTLSRKAKEALLAYWAELLYSKDEILEMYLNQVPYGGTAWGVEAASFTYFGKSVRDLTLAESALLAGLPEAPSVNSPFGSKPERAFERQTEVLRRMVEEKFITQDEADQAKNEQIIFAPQRTTMRAPHFVMYIRELLEKKYGTRLVDKGGLQVITSLDLGVQETTERIVREELANLERLNVTNGAVLVTNPQTGEILAMVGSNNYWDSERDGNVNITTTLQPPGSTIKAVTYAAALENGYTAASILNDSPIVYKIEGSKPYAPVNYDRKFHGLVPVRYALANSYNVPAVKVLDDIGVDVLVEKGRQMGIQSWSDPSRYGLSLTLGGADVTMLDMARSFGALANGGRRVELMPILEVQDYKGKTIEKNKPSKGVRVVKEEAAWIISNILSDNKARSRAFGLNSELVIPDKTVSVKTGTSNDKRDNWAIGYTPSLLTTVWVGNNDNSPMHPRLSSGLTGASTIWQKAMIEMLDERDDEVLPMPGDVVEVPCHFGKTEYFIRGTEPAGGRCKPIPTPTPTGEPTPIP